jgi:hypothetical protein
LSTPVRTLHVDSAIGDVAAYFGSPDATLIHLDNPRLITLALHPVNGTSTAIHALTGDPDGRKEVSRWLEIQRANVERAAA